MKTRSPERRFRKARPARRAKGQGCVWRSTGRYALPFLKVGRKVRYRRAFSESEMAEEVAAGLRHGLSEQECAIDGYFRVDIRIGFPNGDSIDRAKAALKGFRSDQY